MATYIEAFVACGPRLMRRLTVHVEELVERLTGTTSPRIGQARRVLGELADALVDSGRRGAGLAQAGIGTFEPGLEGDRPPPSSRSSPRFASACRVSRAHTRMTQERARLLQGREFA